MRILILGGTGFLGRHIVDACLKISSDVCILNRGLTAPDLYPELKHITADRNNGSLELDEQQWDVVIDASCATAQHMSSTGVALTGRVQHYILISTMAVYQDWWSHPYILESHEVMETGSEDPQVYGSEKVKAEKLAQEYFGEKLLILRPCHLIGPHDNKTGLSWWINYICNAQTIFCPGNPQRSLQLLDARDLAYWTVQSALSNRCGIYNLGAPEHHLSIYEFMQAIASEYKQPFSPGKLTESEILNSGLIPLKDIPFWLPGHGGTISWKKARIEGFQPRSFFETLADIRINYSEDEPAHVDTSYFEARTISVAKNKPTKQELYPTEASVEWLENQVLQHYEGTEISSSTQNGLEPLVIGQQRTGLQEIYVQHRARQHISVISPKSDMSYRQWLERFPFFMATRKLRKSLRKTVNLMFQRQRAKHGEEYRDALLIVNSDSKNKLKWPNSFGIDSLIRWPMRPEIGSSEESHFSVNRASIVFCIHGRFSGFDHESGMIEPHVRFVCNNAIRTALNGSMREYWMRDVQHDMEKLLKDARYDELALKIYLFLFTVLHHEYRIIK